MLRRIVPTTKSLLRSAGIAHRRTITASTAIYTKYNSSNPATAPQSLSHKHNEKSFNESPSLEQMKENDLIEQELVKGGSTGKEFVNHNVGEFKDLKEKGERIPEEQERPDDWM